MRAGAGESDVEFALLFGGLTLDRVDRGDVPEVTAVILAFVAPGIREVVGSDVNQAVAILDQAHDLIALVVPGFEREAGVGVGPLLGVLVKVGNLSFELDVAGAVLGRADFDGPPSGSVFVGHDFINVLRQPDAISEAGQSRSGIWCCSLGGSQLLLELGDLGFELSFGSHVFTSEVKQPQRTVVLGH